jgi:hypothetical protein
VKRGHKGHSKGHHGKKGGRVRSGTQQPAPKPPLDPEMSHLFEYIEAMKLQDNPQVRLVYAKLTGQTPLIEAYEDFRNTDIQQQARTITSDHNHSFAPSLVLNLQSRSSA